VTEGHIAQKAIDRFKMHVRELTRRTMEVSLSKLVEKLTPYLVGGVTILAVSKTREPFPIWMHGFGGDYACIFELHRHGVPKMRAAVASGSPTWFWRISDYPPVQQALRISYISLHRLAVSLKSELIEPSWYATRTPGDVTGTASP
jgi:hypothetical protein